MHYLLLLLFFISGSIFSQTFEKNINLPNVASGGSFIGDILIANDKLFTYSADGISIYNASSNAFIEKIFFTKAMGKFNPVYYNERLHVSDQSIMVYNDEQDYKYVYILTPKLKLLIINTEIPANQTEHQYWITSLNTSLDVQAPLDVEFQSQNSRVILRYDNDANNTNPLERHHRLYVLVSGRDKDNNSIGNFHQQKSIFGLYNINYAISPDNPDHVTLQYSNINTPNDFYGDQINNYIFNEENNYFYLVRLGITSHDPDVSKAYVDVKNITTSGVQPVTSIELDNPEGYNWFKMGKILYINENNIHKIIVFPYRYFTGTVPKPRFFVIDANTNIAKPVTSPCKMITDAVFLGQNNDLIISYSPNNDEIEGTTLDPHLYDNTNIFIYRYNFVDNIFEPIQWFDNNNSVSTSAFDLNASLHLTKLNNSTAIISKKDDISKLSNDAGTYNYSLLHSAEGNSFGKGVLAGTKTYINNTVANGLDILNYTGGIYSHIETKKTAYSAYHISANTDGSKLMFFNKLNAYNTGLYSYNSTTGSTIYINIEKAIGDVVYNPFQDQFLISEFQPGDAKIIVLNASTNNVVYIINIPSEQFAKEMFISPQGKLYITTNMQYEVDQTPNIYIYDATDTQYGFIESNTLDSFDSYDKPFSYYFANFSYNPHDEKVYATVTVQEQKLQPHNTEASSIYYSEEEDPSIPPGKIIALTDNIENQLNLANFPYKVICPANEGVDNLSQYYGKLFIIGDWFYVYDYLNPPVNSSDMDIFDEHHFIDMVYSKTHDKLFAVKEIETTIEYRKFEIWTIEINESGETVIELYNTDFLSLVDGQIVSIFSNPYDGKIYIYQKVDAAKLGDNDVTLYSFNPSDETPMWDLTPLGFATYFPDYDHTRDLSMFFFNNRITPYISPYTNKIYLPNGGHSSVSVVNFDANETMTINPGSNWISIPRHSGNVTQGTYDPWPTNLVFHKDNFETPYSRLELKHNKTQANYEHEYKATYNIDIDNFWYYQDDMGETFSYRGYKLDYFQSSSNTISLTGNVEDPNTTIHLYEDKENWIGYFLYEKQDIFDAIADFKDQLYMIKGQDYFCYYGNANYSGGTPVPAHSDWWICDKLNRNIDYGEMVVLKSYDDIPAFQWNYSGNPPKIVIDEKLEYYTYAETADYSAFIIELDSTENPVEMGAFVNDSCIGACTLTPEDTLVIIKGYLGSQPGDSVVFEEYFAQKATNNKRISDYFVYNSQRKVNEKRVIKTGENKDMYFISFKPGNEQILTEPEYSFSIFPNPTDDILNINYSVEYTTKVNISVFDSYGRQVATLLSKQVLLGSHTLQWNLIGSNGVKVTKGLYIIKLKINDMIISRKVVVN